LALVNKLDLLKLNTEFENVPPKEILLWAWDSFKPSIAVTSSFQTQSLPLLHMISEYVPEMSILFLDTGFHFPETLAFRDLLVQKYKLNIKNLKTEMGHDGFKNSHGDLYRQNPDLCCFINKVEPLKKAMRDLQAWVSGIRRDQTDARRNIDVITLQPDGLYKICPLASWTRQDIWQYIYDHNLPEHPLLAQGYLSIGCAPCTRQVFHGEDERAGRWPGTEKTECGLHIPTDGNENKKNG
jgi:phosphoadenosine phosphosulfate reductase